MKKPLILISAGEPSGEMYAARLAAALRARTGAHLFGLGGPRMREAGVELLADSSQVAVVGISEVVRRLPSVWKVYRQLADEAERRKPDLAILVDFPDFNLRLARRLHKQGVRIVYFISPQVWAWRPKRVQLIRRLVARVLCIFPFEEDFYRKAEVPVNFVGHPLVDSVKPTLSREQFASKHGLDTGKRIVALLPGSRPSEIAHNLPVMLEACRFLASDTEYQFVLAAAPGVAKESLSAMVRNGPPVHIVEGATYDALAAADCAIVSSGTATVEAALLGVPMVVVYRVSATTAFIARRLVRTPHFAMVNLIAGRRVVPELIQEAFTPEAVAAEARRLLGSAEERETMRRELAEVKRRLGPGGAIERAAGIIAGML
ncbi:MAG: lipid-A-disaccharide synthase [Acidobacteria bacterium]|nr:lipid-A-disaccharide synthase [Acidobacteriota bacterium]MCL5287303.1 lipid-A-disaccharide synthase [Acidobacteriota bacterium]